MSTLYFEDFTLGRTFRPSPVTLSEADIIAYARQYDPQAIHTDPVAALDGPFGGLIASGHQTLAVAFGAWIRLGHFADSSLGGPALDEARWTAPVRPGDTLLTTVEVIEARPLRSRPDRGIVCILISIANSAGPVASFKSKTFVKRRP